MSILPLWFSRSFSSTFTHSTPLSPSASMHSLKLCLIAFHHSQAHSTPSAHLHLTRTRRKRGAPAHSNVWCYLTDSVIFALTVHLVPQFDSLCLFFRVHLLIPISSFEACSTVTAPLTSEPGYVLGWKSNQKASSPSGISRTGHLYFLH